MKKELKEFNILVPSKPETVIFTVDYFANNSILETANHTYRIIGEPVRNGYGWEYLIEKVV